MGLVLCQLATNGVVAGADEDVLEADNPVQIAAAKANVAEIMKAIILLDGQNGQKYKHIKDDLEN